MKYSVFTISLFTFLIYWINSSAQINESGFPSAGTNFLMAKSPVYPSKKIGIRDLGDKSWDLSGYLPESFDTLRLKEPLNTKYGRRFPNANVALVTSPVQIEYLIVDSGRVFLTGLVDDFMEKKLPVLLQFKDTLLYKNPHLSIDEQYSDTSTTTFLSPYYNHPATDSIRADISYIRTGRVDASGQLITPLGKYNVEREVIFIEKIVKGYKYSVFGWTPAPEYSLNKHYTLYRWYTKDSQFPLAEAYLNNDDYIEYVKYQYDSPLRLSFSGEHVKCKGGSDGSIQMTVKGGIPDYIYEWTNGETTRDLKNMKAGTYGVKVTDNRGRKISSYYTVVEPHFELAAKLDVKHISCRGLKDGKIKLFISGGTAPYDFTWSNDSVNETMSNLPIGQINLYVVDAGGCTLRDSILITQPEKKLSVAFDEKLVSCYHGNNGSAQLFATGGTAPYHYLWADGDTCSIKMNMKAGQYPITTIDKNNCTANGTVTIKEPESALAISKKITPASCYGSSDGSIELAIGGGRAPYQYLWPDSSDNKNLKGIPAGNYTITVTDKNGCQLFDSAYVSQPTAPLKIDYNKKDVLCFGENTGEITLKVSGGTKEYSYSWYDGTNKPDLLKLKEGTYKVKVSDKNNCFESETIEILAPQKALFADFEKFDVKCKDGNDGSISLTVEGATPEYTFLWSNKSTQKDLKGLKAGKYSVLISDKNNCKLKKDYEINQPDKIIEVAVQKTDADCYGAKTGSIYLDVNGGKPGYNYEWSNNTNSQNIIEIGAGKYTVTITDAALCKVVKIIEIAEPEKLSVKADISSTDKDKENGSIKIEIKGGTQPYVILWDNGNTSNFIEKLPKGSFEVQITDSKDCNISEVFKVEEK
jgi:hypothetical protein